MSSESIGLALLGVGGHQPTEHDVAVAGAHITARVDATLGDVTHLRARAAEICAEPTTRLVAVDVAPRSLQVDLAIIALEAGCHVIIERPAATTTVDLARLAAAAAASPGGLWERATTFFDEPYRRVREIVAAGEIGEVVLVTTHRSYPWAPWRPTNESLTGGLVLQSAGYGLDVARMVTGQAIHSVSVLETTAGDPAESDMRMAAIVSAQFDDGAIASVVVDYLKTPGEPWGRDELRIVGTAGLLAVDGIARTIEVTTAAGTRREERDPIDAGLLRAIVDAIRTGAPSQPPASDLMASTTALVRALENRRTTAQRNQTEEARQ